jgi:integrator complex subunit 11
MVVFATPGMLHAGLSLQIFKRWAPNENNMVIMPGYCVSGTVGSKVLSGQKKIELENGHVVDVKMAVEYMSFSAHADAKGIMQLIHYCQPKNVLLVHGEAAKMEFLQQKINKEFGIQCYMPANGETCTITANPDIPVDIQLSIVKKEQAEYDLQPPDPKRQRLIHGVLIMNEEGLKIVDIESASQEIGMPRHTIRFTEKLVFREFGAISRTTDKIAHVLKNKLSDLTVEVLSENEISISQKRVTVRISPVPKSETEKEVATTWGMEDDELGSFVFALLLTVRK